MNEKSVNYHNLFLIVKSNKIENEKERFHTSFFFFDWSYFAGIILQTNKAINILFTLP